MADVAWTTLMPEPCEKFVSIMLLREFPLGRRRRPSQGDGGVDVMVPVEGLAKTYDVYQIKYFSTNLGASEKRQIKKSIKTIHATVEREGITVRNWHLTLPLDATKEQEKWLADQFEGSSIAWHWNGRTYLDGLVSKYPDVVDFYINNSRERLDKMMESVLSLAHGMKDIESGSTVDFATARTMATALFESLNSSDPQYIYDLAIEASEPDLQKFVTPSLVMSYCIAESIAGPFLVFNVNARYVEAPEDRPIRAHMTLSPGDSETAAKAIEDFRIYGLPLSLDSDHAQVKTEDPFTPDDAPAMPATVQLSRHRTGSEDRKFRLTVRADDDQDSQILQVKLNEVTVGTTKRGMRARLVSASGSTEIDHRSRMPDAQEPAGLTSFTLTITWVGRIAAEIIDDMRFGAAAQSGTRVMLGPPYGGQLQELMRVEGVEEAAVPQIALEYAEALVQLQPYASGPLTLTQNKSEVDQAISLARLLSGEENRETTPGLKVDYEQPDELIASINEINAVAIKNPVSTQLSGQDVVIPDVYFLIENAEVVSREGQSIILRQASPDGIALIVTMTDPVVDNGGS